MRTLLALLALVAAFPAPAEPLTVTIQSPVSVANDPVAIEVIVDDDQVIPPPGGADGQSVSVTMGGLTTQLVRGTVCRPFKPPCGWPGWVGSLDVSTLPEGTYDIVATALNSLGQPFTATASVVLDRRPVIQVQQPAWSAATWLQVPVSATCTDSQGCVSFTAYPNAGGPWALTGTSSLSGSLDVSQFDGYGLQYPFAIDFKGTDPRGQVTQRSVRVYPEGSPHVRAVTTAPGVILDADATRLLYQDETGRLLVRDRASSADTLIHPAMGYYEAYLTTTGAFFRAVDSASTHYRVKSWENGTLVELGEHSFHNTANGRYAVWTQYFPPSTIPKLFWRDVVAGETREIASAQTIAFGSIGPNGTVPYWYGTSPAPYELRLYDPVTASTTVIVPSNSCSGSAPRTDGVTVVYRRVGCGVDAVYAYAAGTTRTVMPLPFSGGASYDVAGGWIGVAKDGNLYRFDPQGASSTIATSEGPMGEVDRIGTDGLIVTGGGTYSHFVSGAGEFVARRASSAASRTIFISGALHFALGNTLFVHERAEPKISTRSLAFDATSMGTVTDPPKAVTLTNYSTASVTITDVTLPPNYRRIHDCAALASGQSCTIQVAFAPGAAPIALNALTDMPGALSITSTGAPNPIRIALFGIGEKSLVRHYYTSILGRQPDSGGKSYWESEATRMFTLGANLNEAWYAMAMAFFSSGEYTSVGRTNATFATNLYRTFFSRDADDAGLAYWTGQLDAGLPREVALASFMFSPEFTAITQSVYGNTAARAEVDMVVDFYRGLLGRLPDTSGFNHWVGQFRAAQCQGAPAVLAQVEAISGAFAGGSEYAARQRTNPAYVGDLYNAFLRRGGDLAGVKFWIDQLNAGRPRDELRRAFVASAEFSARVQAVVAQGCIQN